MTINFKPPEAVRNNYKRGLELHEAGNTGDGLEQSTIAMARKLADGQEVSREWARKANRFWGRNERFLDEPKDSAAYASAMLWGGAAGRDWYASLVKQMDEEMKTNYVQVINSVDTARIRIERDDAGDEIVILPGYTMPDDIVMNRIMYPREEIEASYRGLEGIPAPIGHPVDSDGNYVSASSEIGVNRFQHGAFVGRVERHDGRVYVETRINKRVAAQTDQGKRLLRLVRDLMDGLSDEPIHTSTGVYMNMQKLPQTRVCDRGREYDAIGRGFVFDHNAILLDEEGAATPAEGVGMLVNRDKSPDPISVMRCNSVEFAQNDCKDYDTQDNQQTEGKNMALKDMLTGFLKANKVDVAADASDADLVGHLEAMKTNAEIEPEQVDHSEIITNALSPIAEKLDSLQARFNKMDEEEKAALMKKLKDNGYEEDKLKGMSMDDMKKAVSELKSNHDADFSGPGQYQANSNQSDSLTTKLEDW